MDRQIDDYNYNYHQACVIWLLAVLLKPRDELSKYATNTQNMILCFAPNLQGRCKNCPNDWGAKAVAAAISQQVRTEHCQSKSDLIFFGQALQGTEVWSR